MVYDHCPDDIKEAIDQYDRDVKSGKIKPWNPDTRDEYTHIRADQDLWLACFLMEHLAPPQLGY